MEFWTLVLILVAGFAAGCINTIAGGGSLITLPVLIFAGLPSAVANGTNRIAIVGQGITSILGYRSKGIKSGEPYSIWLGISAMAGAFIGAYLAVDIKDQLFNRILAIVMIFVVISLFINPKSPIGNHEELMDKKRRIWSVLVFFFIGIYGGFIQAGIGYLIMASLTWINRLDLVRVNAIKVVVVLILTLSALGVFIWEGKIDWYYGLVLTVGNMAGGWFSSRWSVAKGEAWIKRFVLVTVVAMAIKLWFF